MQQCPVKFHSSTYRLDGDLYWPDDLERGERRPAVVTTSGYQGLKDIHPARFARFLTERGYVCLAFDYRGFGASEGERGRLVPQDQVEDTRAAVNFLETVDWVDRDRIGMIGWALGGGVALEAAVDDPRVRALAVINAVSNGERLLRHLHDEDSWRHLLEQVAADRRQRVRSGRSQAVNPFEVVRLDETTAGYVVSELYKAAGFGSDVTLESVDMLMRFRPELHVDRLAPRPLLIIHGAENGLHDPCEAREIHARARQPVRLRWLEGCGHTEWMSDDHPAFGEVVDELAAFFGDALAAPGREAEPAS